MIIEKVKMYVWIVLEIQRRIAKRIIKILFWRCQDLTRLSGSVSCILYIRLASSLPINVLFVIRVTLL